MGIEVGQIVSVQSDLSLQRGYVVTKISPTGQITVERNGVKRRFTKEGYEIGSPGFYARARLVVK